jgi:hypothetical protein
MNLGMTLCNGICESLSFLLELKGDESTTIVASSSYGFFAGKHTQDAVDVFIFWISYFVR